MVGLVGVRAETLHFLESVGGRREGRTLDRGQRDRELRVRSIQRAQNVTRVRITQHPHFKLSRAQDNGEGNGSSAALTHVLQSD